MAIEFKPMADTILVRIVRPSATTKAGLEIPADKRRKTRRCLVLAVGPDVTGIKPDDIVCLPAWYDQGGGNIIHGELLSLPSYEVDELNVQRRVEYALLKEMEVMGIFTGDRETLLSPLGPQPEELERDIETGVILTP